jgi:SAM-dependent methyltransferase
VRWVFEKRPAWSKALIDLRTRQVLAMPDRMRIEAQDWLKPALHSGTFLDIGCGSGGLLAAAATLGMQGIGIDVCMVWLQVAARMIKAHGGIPILSAAMAEALPLANDSIGGVVSLDVIEHVGNPTCYLKEIDRITAPGGHIALATPNRFSLSAEPHVSIWGVGWLPRRLQKHYVQWRSGQSYEFTRLLSCGETAQLFRRSTRFDCRVLVPAIPESEIARFSTRRRMLARAYNSTLALGMQRLLQPVCPFFRVVVTRG